jgi:hypothetical protein
MESHVRDPGQASPAGQLRLRQDQWREPLVQAMARVCLALISDPTNGVNGAAAAAAESDCVIL